MTARAALASANAKVRRIASEIDRVRERSKGDEADWKATTDRVEVAESRKRERAEADRLHDSLGEGETKSPGIVAELQVFRRAKENFDWRMEGLWGWGDKRVRSFTPNIDAGGRQGEAGCCSQ